MENNKFGLLGNDCATGGFFSTFLTTLGTAVSVDKCGLTPYVNITDSFFTRYDIIKPNDINSWNWWFVQKTPNENDQLIPFKYNLENFNQSIPFWKDGKKRLEIINGKNIFNKYFKIKDDILLKVKEYSNNYFNNNKILGVMARLNEFYFSHPSHGNQNIMTYLEGTKKMLKKYTDIKYIFLVTEENDCIDAFKKEFDNLLYLDVFRRTIQSKEYCAHSSTWFYENPPRDNHSKLIGDECLIQALLLSSCDYLVCKMCGTADGSIFFSENLKDVLYV